MFAQRLHAQFLVKSELQLQIAAVHAQQIRHHAAHLYDAVQHHALAYVQTIMVVPMVKLELSIEAAIVLAQHLLHHANLFLDKIQQIAPVISA